MEWISAGDLKSWCDSDQRDCASLLPQVLRRLILATSDSVSQIVFPQDDSIATPGWDGKLDTSTVSPHFPSGISGWEIGTEPRPKSKAEGDFLNREIDPLGLVPKDTTFVFVTPRRWPGRQAWIDSKLKTSKWKGIRVISADELTQWLDEVPAVALWLAKHLGKAASIGLRSIESYWEEWSKATKPPLTTEVVLSDRGKEAGEIAAWLDKSPSPLSLQSDSADESFAFLYSSLTKLSDSKQIRALSRCLYVDNPDSLRHLLDTYKNPLILAVTVECNDLVGLALSKGHHVFLGTGTNISNSRDKIQLSRPLASTIQGNLQKNGIKEVEAKKISRDCGRSLTVLRRRMTASPIKTNPPWVNPQNAHLLLPILFVGAWDEGKEGDKEIIESLSTEKYSDYLLKLRSLLSVTDSPLVKIGSIWLLKSPIDTWFLISSYVSDEILHRFQQVIKNVLLKVDPKYELPADQQWAAAVYGKIPSYSDWLREGLCNALAMISVFGDQATNVSSLQDIVNQTVSEIVKAANTFVLWASLKDITPFLAEAAPEHFLEELAWQLRRNSSVFAELMKDGKGGLFGDCNHSGLLWALESLAWSPEYFAQSVEILREMALIDTGGRYSNRPVNSLTDIFMPYWPQTYASPAQRIQELDKLIIKDPKLVWNFTKRYHSGGSFSETYRFKWTDYGSLRGGFDKEENAHEYLAELITRLTKLACMHENIPDAMDEFNHLPMYIQTELISTLLKTSNEHFSSSVLKILYSHIREAMNWISSYGDKEQRKHIPQLRRLLIKFTPKDLLESLGWLLENPWPHLPEVSRKNRTGGATEAILQRNKAARKVLDKVPLKRIVKYASSITYIGVLGTALGNVIRNEEEDYRVVSFFGKHSKDPLLLSSYSSGRYEKEGKEWVVKMTKMLKERSDYEPGIGAQLYLGLPEGIETWSAVEKQGNDLETEYWKYARGYSHDQKNESAQFACEKLLLAKRPQMALEIAGDHTTSLPSKLLKQIILDLLSVPSGERRRDSMTEYYLSNIFRQLQDRKELSDEEIAKLEWPCASLFHGMQDNTKNSFSIHKLLENDPIFFCDLVGMIFKREDKKTNPMHANLSSDEADLLARNARSVLESWQGIPGKKEDGSVDEEKLSTWVKTTRKVLSERALVNGGDLEIANILARMPYDPDGCWPHKAARKIIENLDNKTINRGIQSYVYNNRGVTTRGPNDGGNQERFLAEKYQKMYKQVVVDWPITALILKGISDFYAHLATREDLESELHEQKWG